MDINLYAGDSRNIVVNVVDENNAPINLYGATIEWVLVSGSSVILTKAIGSGIMLSDPANGGFTIPIMASETDSLMGIYTHEARVTSKWMLRLVLLM